MAEKIIGVYKITNTVTGDFYVGSSKDVKRRWSQHKCKYVWNEQQNNPMYQDFQRYGVNKFEFKILAEVEIGSLKEMEQQFIKKLKPTYNDRNANGLDVDKYKKYHKEYEKSNKYKDYQKDYKKKYYNQLCCYNGEELTLRALSLRFYKAGIEHPTLEAKKYLLTNLQS